MTLLSIKAIISNRKWAIAWLALYFTGFWMVYHGWFLSEKSLRGKQSSLLNEQLFYYKVRHDGITRCDTSVYYKVRQGCITKCDNYFITKYDKCYYKVRRTKCDGTVYLLKEWKTGKERKKSRARTHREHWPHLPSLRDSAASRER